MHLKPDELTVTRRILPIISPLRNTQRSKYGSAGSFDIVSRLVRSTGGWESALKIVRLPVNRT